MQWARNRDEFLDLIDQAIFEIEDLCASAADEGDEDDLSRYVPVYRQIEEGLRTLRREVSEERHVFADGSDLPVFTLAVKWKARLPVFGVLDMLNRAHRRGLD
ncbi:MAG: hypothetical protein ACYCQK_06190 [Acidiferrobacteraceae bacterium]